jgi:hypothetical protein
MTRTSAPVSTALPAVGLCGVTLPADGPSIRILHMTDLDGYIVAYDKHTWTVAQIEDLVRIYLGDFQLVEPADGA